jgi:hypothetical protein
MQTKTTAAAGHAKLEQLKKLLAIIEKLEVYIDGDKRLLLSETAANFPDIRKEAQLRIQNRVYLVNRLHSYYAKKVFKLASDTYNGMQC